MRLDLFLKVSRLIVRRTVAQEMCDAGAVKINDIKAKPAREVHPGDVLAIRQRGRTRTVRVLIVPESKSSHLAPGDMYELVSDEKITDNEHPLG